MKPPGEEGWTHSGLAASERVWHQLGCCAMSRPSLSTYWITWMPMIFLTYLLCAKVHTKLRIFSSCGRCGLAPWCGIMKHRAGPSQKWAMDMLGVHPHESRCVILRCKLWFHERWVLSVELFSFHERGLCRCERGLCRTLAFLAHTLCSLRGITCKSASLIYDE